MLVIPFVVLTFIAAPAVQCRGAEAHAAECKEEHDGHSAGDYDHEEAEAPRGEPGAEFEVPEASARLLGLTFAKAEARDVRKTLRFPGRFEWPPELRRTVASPLSGEVTLMVRELQQVSAGETLFVLRSPEWLQLAGDLSVAEAELRFAEKEAALLAARLDGLRAAGVAKADVKMQAELKPAECERLRSRVAALARRKADLLEPFKELAGGGLACVAREAGVVASMDCESGQWVAAGGRVMGLKLPGRLRLRAEAAAAALQDVPGGAAGVIEPPRALAGADAVDGGRVAAGFADAVTGIRPLWCEPKEKRAWMQEGAPAMLAVVRPSDAADGAAVPEGAVVQDGVAFCVFVKLPGGGLRYQKRAVSPRDRANGWFAVDGLAVGESVVVDGAYELKLIAPGGQGAKRTAGHFHADGKFHEGKR